MSSVTATPHVKVRRYRAISPGETVLLILGLLTGFLVAWLGGMAMGELFPDLSNIGWVLLYLIAAVALPSFVAPVLGMAFPSWRYKTVCGVILLFVLLGLGITDAVRMVPHGFNGVLGALIRFGVRISGALGGFRLWRVWRDAYERRPRKGSTAEVVPSPDMPRTPAALLVVSLLSVPVTYISIFLSMFVTIGLSALLFFILSDLERVPIVLIVAAALAPIGGAWAAIKALRVAVSPPVGSQPAIVLPVQRRPVLRRLVSAVCEQVGTRMPDQVILHANPTFYVTQGKVLTMDGVVKGRTLALGLPLVKALSGAELSAVMAHEFAHFSGRDTLYSAVAAPVLQGLQTSVRTLGGMRGGGGSLGVAIAALQLPSVHFLIACAMYFHSITMIISRRRELRADWVAAHAFGKEAFCGALRRTVEIASDYPESMKTLKWKGAGGLFAAYAELIGRQAVKLAEYSQKALEEQETEDSSHPSLRTREASLPPFKPTAKVPPGDLAGELAEDEERLSAAFAPLVESYQQQFASEVKDASQPAV